MARGKKGARVRGGAEARPAGGPPVAAGPARKVRCLGPGPEHRWVSPDPARHRICPKCQKKVEQMNPGVRQTRTHSVSME